MRIRLLSACSVLAALVATNASAQGVNLTGQYQCVHACQPPFAKAYITQNGWILNLINEAGQPSGIRRLVYSWSYLGRELE